MLIRFYKGYRRGKFGSRFTARLVLLFAVIGILPGTVIFVVSVQFVSRSIESWFDIKVESALQSGINLGQAALDGSLSELASRAHNMVLELSDLSEPAQATQLSRMRDQGLMQEATILTADGKIIATDGGRLAALVPELPTSSMLRQARMSHGFSAIENNIDAERETGPPKTGPPQEVRGLRLRVVMAIPGSSNPLALRGETRYLQLIQPVPVSLADNASALQVSYSEYQERSLARSGLRKMYISTLVLTLLLAIFGAVASAFLIATNLAKPLLVLAEGTKAVAEGDLSPRPIVASNDELGTLTQSFNTMTRQLFDARTAVEKNRAELENAKAYLESVLANMSAGVMVLDGDFHLVSCNESVARILQHDFEADVGRNLTAIDGVRPFGDAVIKAFTEQSAQAAGGVNDVHWQQQIEVPQLSFTGQAGHDITLLTRGSRLPVQNGNGYIVVFDDVSNVISAQRSIAWGEVARRLAHEIKNPLTPIQLSAERLQMKLEGKLASADAAMLHKSTLTIVNQVSSMKRMVDDFRDYAKTPPAVLSPLDLNSLIEEILHLYIGGDERDIIHAALAPQMPQVMGDATQLRQVIHNLLQNAQDAVADRRKHAAPPRIEVVTEVVRYQNADGKACSAVRLSISDSGLGFAPHILKRAFEPYITTKPRGTGLGLAMVKKIVDEHGGRVDIQNRSDTSGAKVQILLLKLAHG